MLTIPSALVSDFFGLFVIIETDVTVLLLLRSNFCTADKSQCQFDRE
ncbi:MAG: hypothetical protein LBT09_09880 [Planctomycetaceae bacterium]|nr:hypothetical protein [Planctomycetaceae bacterium]